MIRLRHVLRSTASPLCMKIAETFLLFESFLLNPFLGFTWSRFRVFVSFREYFDPNKQKANF